MLMYAYCYLCLKIDHRLSINCSPTWPPTKLRGTIAPPTPQDLRHCSYNHRSSHCDFHTIAAVCDYFFEIICEKSLLYCYLIPVTITYWALTILDILKVYHITETKCIIWMSSEYILFCRENFKTLSIEQLLVGTIIQCNGPWIWKRWFNWTKCYNNELLFSLPTHRNNNTPMWKNDTISFRWRIWKNKI